MREQAEYAGHTEEFNQCFLKTVSDLHFLYFLFPFDFFFLLLFNTTPDFSVVCALWSWIAKGERTIYCLLNASDLEEES